LKPPVITQLVSVIRNLHTSVGLSFMNFYWHRHL